jgi:transcriptional regulator with XRE-family HTH domain
MTDVPPKVAASVDAAPVAPDDAPEPQPTFGEWLNKEMERQNVTIQQLADKTRLTYTGIWNIVKGNTLYPREETRKRLSAALNQPVPTEVEHEIEQESAILGYTWTDFTPSDLETVPQLGGVYVFYDITDRPVYVGKSRQNVRGRVQDHQTRFWFKHPLVVRGSFLAIDDPVMCDKIEAILIKFLGNHALLNVKGVVRDRTD